TAIDIAIDLKDASRHILDIQGVVNSDANGNASFYYTAPTTGTYYLDIGPSGSDPQGQLGNYDVGVVDFCVQAPDTIPDGPSTTSSLTMNGTVLSEINLVPASGSSNVSLDHDWFAVSLTAGHDYSFTASSFPPSGLIDVAVALRDANGNI